MLEMTNSVKEVKSVTCQMIADMAGVSRATVRRVMRNEPYVKDDVRKRVTEIVEKYHYKANTAGLTLVNRRRTSIKLGVISFKAVDALYEELNRGSQKASVDYQEYGIDIIFKYIDDTATPEEVVEVIGELIDEGIRGLAIMGIDLPEVRDALLQVQEKIPIVTYNSSVSGIDELCFVGQNARQTGRTAAVLMNGMLGGKGRIAIVVNSMNVLAVAVRAKAFQEKIDELGGMKADIILENQSSNTRSYNLLKERFDRGEHFDGIYIASGFGSKGICSALDEYGMNETHIVAHDLLPYTVELLKAGKVDFSIDQELFRQGYLPVEILAKYVLFSEKPEGKCIYTKIDIKTSENLD